jgi:acetylornithine deacetylase
MTPHTLELIRQLVAFNTVSRESNLGLIEWTRDYLKGLGAQTRLTYDASRKKANLFATIGDGPSAGTVFSGHTDVVPVDGQDWRTNPFEAVVADGKIFGRGTCDMKSYIAVCLSKAEAFAHASLESPIHFAFSYDEEVGCLGVKELIADLAENGIRPAACIIGEPTSMQPIIAHKGKRAYRCCVKGQAAHSSSPHLGINAIEFAAELIVHIRRLGNKLRIEGKNDPEFDVPFTTLLTTLIQGGNAANTIPENCEFVFEYRYLPDVDPDAIINELRTYAADHLAPQMRSSDAQGGIEFRRLTEYPGLGTSISDAVVALAMQLTDAKRVKKVAFGTEGGLFSNAGIPTVICGPGDIAQAHKPNEFITLEQVARCERFFDDFIAARGRMPTGPR